MSTDMDHRRRKPGTKPNYQANGAQGPTSQIPGLSNSANTAPLEKSRGRRVGIFETDSEYVKLAKQGGQRGLLWHEETNLETKPNAQYRPPDWFSASDKEQKCPSKGSTPELLTPEEDKDSPTKGAILRQANAPFGSDNKSTWEREADNFTSGRDKIIVADHAEEQMKKMSLASGNDDANKYKRTCYDKKATPVSMSKLLSFGYVEKSTKDDDDESSVTSDPASSIALDEDLE